MLDTIGLSKIEDLVAHLPKTVRYDKPLAIAPGRSEYDILDYFKERGADECSRRRRMVTRVFSAPVFTITTAP